jgi:hypothetical protein
MELKDLIQALVEAKDKLKVIDDKYEAEATPLKEAKKDLEAKIIQTFKDRGEYSTRIEKATASLSVRKTAQIADEKAVVQSLKSHGLSDYVEERVSDLFKDSVLKEQAKLNEADILPGVIIKETEYLSIRSNDKVDARKQTTNEFVKTPKEQ